MSMTIPQFSGGAYIRTTPQEMSTMLAARRKLNVDKPYADLMVVDGVPMADIEAVEGDVAEGFVLDGTDAERFPAMHSHPHDDESPKGKNARFREYFRLYAPLSIPEFEAKMADGTHGWSHVSKLTGEDIVYTNRFEATA